MRGVLGVARLGRALVHVLAGWLTILFVFPRLHPVQRAMRVQVWAARMLPILGVRLQLQGQPPVIGPLLLVANHLSWLDILVLHAARYCRFVAKSDLKGWPLIGALATGAGTLYIERSRRSDAMRVVHHMAQALRDGEIVAVFPEGTTGDGTQVLPFHANLLQAAISADAPVLAVALRYIDRRTGADSPSPLYIGDDTLIGSLWRTVTGPPFVARVSYGDPAHAAGRDRRTWAQALRVEVERRFRD